MNNTPPAVRAILARIALVCPAEPAVPTTKQLRLEALVKEIQTARACDRAALAVQIRDTIQEPEPVPVPKTPEQLAAQRIQDERAWMELIRQQKVMQS